MTFTQVTLGPFLVGVLRSVWVNIFLKSCWRVLFKKTICLALHLFLFRFSFYQSWKSFQDLLTTYRMWLNESAFQGKHLKIKMFKYLFQVVVWISKWLVTTTSTYTCCSSLGSAVLNRVVHFYFYWERWHDILTWAKTKTAFISDIYKSEI